MDQNETSEKGLDIFDVLNSIRKEDVGYYDRLSDKQKKSFVPYLTYQWLHGAEIGDHTLMLNLANKHIFKLNRHPKLLYMLLIACGSMSSSRCVWPKWVKARSQPSAILHVLMKTFKCSMREAKMYESNFSDNDILLMASELGFQQDEMKDVKTQLSKRST